MEQYDAVVIGSGEAGKYLAWHLSSLGQSVIVVERALVGGACPNIACLPSKNVLHSANVIQAVRHGAAFGAEASGLQVNLATVRERKRDMVRGLIELHHTKFEQSGVELLMGEAHFLEPLTFEVACNDGGSRILRGSKVFLNTGSRAAIPSIPGLVEAQPLTHVEALELSEVPKHLIILGGGFVGLEFAQAYRRFGSRVTLIHHGERLVQDQDRDVSDALLALMQDEGVEVLLRTEATNVEGRSGDEVAVFAADGAPILGTHLMVTAGRQPATQALNLTAGGVQTTASGYIAVNENLETSAPNVWAMGDCTGGPMFTHASYDDFRVVRDQLAGETRTTSGRLIPWTLFTDPELAHVGLSEASAQAQGLRYGVLAMPIAGVLRTRTTGETRGFLKALVGEDERILGFTCLGSGAGEIVAVVQTGMLAGVPYTFFANAIFTHPTIAEGLMYLFSGKPQIRS